MPQKKSKRKNKGQGKIQHKLMLDRQKNEFRQRLIKLAKAAGALDVLKKLPKEELRFLEFQKTSAFRVEAAENVQLPVQILKSIKGMVTSFMKIEMMTIVEGNPQVSLYDYFAAGVSLKHYLRTLKDHTFPTAIEVKEAFADFMNIVDNQGLPRKLLFDYGLTLSWTFSTIDDGYIWFQYDVVIKSRKENYDCYKISIFHPETRNITINGNNRPAFRVGFPSDKNNMEWLKFKAADFGQTGSFANIELDVYIQSHALRRMQERLDTFIRPELHVSLFISLKSAKIINFNKRFLIEYHYLFNKMGYLVCEIIDGVIIIRTFLFITNDGTPEGEKLKELAGLSIIGKKYFDIDKVSTFLYSDIRKDEKLKSLFVKAGCESLFNIKPATKRQTDEIKAAKSITKYLDIE